MAPPVYSDLGRLARDLFKKGYHPGLWQLDCKTMTNSGIEFLTSGFASQDAGKVQGLLQSKYKIEDYGLTLTERWNTENFLYAEIMQRDKLAGGLMLAIEAQFQPQSGDKGGKLKLGYVQENFNFAADLKIDANGPLNTSLVLSYKEFLGGIATQVDIGGLELRSHKFSLGWTNGETALHGELKDGNNFYASIFHRISERVDAAVEFQKGSDEAPPGQEASQGGDLNFGLGCAYRLEDSALVRGKINNNAELGLGYEQKLREGITFTVSTIIETKNLNEGSHKFGVGFALEC